MDTAYILGLLLAAATAGGAVALKYFYPSIPDDNPIEELSEELIKKNVGIDIDLTPNSKEDK
jgi:ABC-type glycerol-3-phosphate transport system substrate-binding protein